jgi:bifunctional ADP-heptose synthase (sugar kinase/adenylyltransferase)
MNTPAQKQFKILLVGDAGTDTYTYGYVDRISPEAPVPVFEPKYDIVMDGLASNVRNNLTTLGNDVTFMYTEECKKNRLMDIRSKQQLIRVDRDSQCTALLKGFVTVAKLNTYQAVVISDYNKGTVSYELIEWLREEFKGPIFIDTKKTDLARFSGCYVKINALEKSRVTSYHPELDHLIVTHGDKGAEWNGWVFPAESAGDVTDVCGAGDTFLSALVYKFLDTNHMPDAIKFAIKASAVTVKHVGVYAPRPEEIK